MGNGKEGVDEGRSASGSGVLGAFRCLRFSRGAAAAR
jgi:hypothetical protein